jgi:hypothetical protein
LLEKAGTVEFAFCDQQFVSAFPADSREAFFETFAILSELIEGGAEILPVA